eukprot:9502805-Pyramimonas_sp.AAC.1
MQTFAALCLTQGASEIIPVETMTLTDGSEVMYIIFQRQRFELDEETYTLKELDCGIDKPLGVYSAAQGVGSAAEVNAIRARFGNNNLNIPLPQFKDVFSKQMLGPIPVFQVGPPTAGGRDAPAWTLGAIMWMLEAVVWMLGA